MLHAKAGLALKVRRIEGRLALQEDGHVWMVMPFINGGSAESILTERHPDVSGCKQVLRNSTAAAWLAGYATTNPLHTFVRPVAAVSVSPGGFTAR